MNLTTFDVSIGNGKQFSEDNDIQIMIDTNRYIKSLHKHKYSKWKLIIDNDNPYLLNKAIESGHFAAVAYLLNLQVDFSYNTSWRHPLNIAIRNKDLNMVKILLGNGFQVTDEVFKIKMNKNIYNLLKSRQEGVLNLSKGCFQFISPKLIDITNVTTIDLSRNDIENIPPDLLFKILGMKDLTTLDISFNKLKAIPDEILTLGNLSSLIVNNNKLESLPYNLSRLKHLDISENALSSSIPENIVTKAEKLVEFLKNSLIPSKRWDRLKVLVVGKENVGKTHLIKSWKKHYYHENISTDGIEIQEIEITCSNSKKIKLSVYDFGGQEVFYPTHTFYMSAQSLYVVVFSLNDESSQSRVHYWLNIIKSISIIPCSVIIVGTHKNKLNESLFNHLKSSYKNIYPNIKGFLAVCCKTQDGINELRELIGEVAQDESIVTQKVPNSYFLMSNIISKLKSENKNYISWKEFKEHCKSVNIYTEQDCIQCAEILHKSGCIVWYNQKKLKSIVVVDPQWLSEVMSSVISFKTNWKDGVLKHELLSFVWKGFPPSVHQDLINILVKFEVIYPIRGLENTSIVPSMLPQSRSHEIDELFSKLGNDKSIQKIERTYRFNFIPLGLFGKLIVKLYHHHDLYCHSPTLESLIVSPNEIAQDIVDDLEDSDNHKILVERSLIEGNEQALITYYGSGDNISVLNILVYRKENSKRFNIIAKIVDMIEEILKTSFQRNENDVVRYIGYNSDFISVNETIDSILNGDTYIDFKKHGQIKIEDVAPDLFLSDVPRVETVEIGDKIGEGEAAIVYHGFINGKEAAIKELKKSDFDSRHHVYSQFQKEVNILKDIDHPNIVKLIGINTSSLQIFLEYIPGKDLFSLLHNKLIPDEALPITLRIKFALDIAKGIQYLQNLSPPLVHRDIRSPNIFVCSLVETDEINVKLSDFGMASRVYTYFNEVLMSWHWMPPEAFGPDKAYYDEKVDIYSFAIVFWEILSRQIPFSEFTEYITEKSEILTQEQLLDEELLESISSFGWSIEGNVVKLRTYQKEKFLDAIANNNLRPTISDTVPIAIKVLIQRAWHHDPEKRPSMNKIVNLLEKVLEKNIEDITPADNELLIRELDSESPTNSFKVSLTTGINNAKITRNASSFDLSVDADTCKLNNHIRNSLRLSMNLNNFSILEGKPVHQKMIGPILKSCRYMVAVGNRVYISTYEGYIHEYDCINQKYLGLFTKKPFEKLTYMAEVGKELWISTEENIFVYYNGKLKTTINYSGGPIVSIIYNPIKSTLDDVDAIIINNEGIITEYLNYEVSMMLKIAERPYCMIEYREHLWIGCDSCIYVFNLQDMAKICKIAFEGIINSFHPVGNDMFCHSYSHSLTYTISMSNFKVNSKLDLKKIVTCIDVVRLINKDYIWCGIDDGDIHIVEYSSNKTIGVLKGHSDYVIKFIKMDILPITWSCSVDGTVIIWTYRFS